ncbi:MAG: hypothetical protein C4318_05435 [Acidimicrobiia bacterium]
MLLEDPSKTKLLHTSKQFAEGEGVQHEMSSTRRCISAFRAALGTIFAAATVVVATGAVLTPEMASAQVVPIVFPVNGPASYTNDFGAPRSGGRTHTGIDIFAPKLTRAVAAEDGYISWWLLNEGSAGYMLELVGRSGYRYWYIHLNNDTPGTDNGQGGKRWAFAVGIEPGAPVRRGQFIGYVGDSGNAEETHPHLHFEIHNPDGTPLNPFDSLNAAVRWAEPDPSRGFSFHEYLTIQNPGDVTAVATPRYLLDGAPPVMGSPVTLPPRSRKTVFVNETIPRQQHGTELRSTEPVVVERPMYFAYGPDLWTGGSVGVGFEQPQTSFYFAEGYTGETFEEYITLANASSTDARVSLDYLIEGEANRSQILVVPAGRRSTVNVKSVVGKGKNVSTVVRSDVPIVAERPMYFAYGTGSWTGGHVSTGLASPAKNFYFAEGYTASGFDEYITLANPNATPATVQLRFLRDRAGPAIRVVTVNSQTRKTLFVPDLIGRGYENSLVVESDLPIAAERPMYFDTANWYTYMGPVSGGTVGVGNRQPSQTWYFAEGYTGNYFKEYLTLGNPDASEALVDIDYHGPSGLYKTVRYRVAPNSRFTVDVNAEIGPDREVAVKIVASHPLIAERPIYFRYLGIWTDGHTSNGVNGPRKDWYFAEGYTG